MASSSPAPTDFAELVNWLVEVDFGCQAALAVELGVDPATVYRWASGDVRPYPRNRDRLMAIVQARHERALVEAALTELGGPDDDPSL